MEQVQYARDLRSLCASTFVGILPGAIGCNWTAVEVHTAMHAAYWVKQTFNNRNRSLGSITVHVQRAVSVTTEFDGVSRDE